MNLRTKLAGLEKLAGAADILGATIDSRTGQLRSVLYYGRGNHPAPPGLTVDDLPFDSLLYEYDPSSECVVLYQSTMDGQAHAQRVLGNENVILGRDRDRGQP
jgi:hypothetical protein